MWRVAGNCRGGGRVPGRQRRVRVRAGVCRCRRRRVPSVVPPRRPARCPCIYRTPPVVQAQLRNPLCVNRRPAPLWRRLGQLPAAVHQLGIDVALRIHAFVGRDLALRPCRQNTMCEYHAAPELRLNHLLPQIVAARRSPPLLSRGLPRLRVHPARGGACSRSGQCPSCRCPWPCPALLIYGRGKRDRFRHSVLVASTPSAADSPALPLRSVPPIPPSRPLSTIIACVGVRRSGVSAEGDLSTRLRCALGLSPGCAEASPNRYGDKGRVWEKERRGSCPADGGKLVAGESGRRKGDEMPDAEGPLVKLGGRGPACSEGSVMDPRLWFWRNSRGARGDTGFRELMDGDDVFG